MSAKRKARREQERDDEKQRGLRRRLLALAPGGTPESPRVVSTASLVEVSATDAPCPACGKPMRVLEHRAEGVATRPMRVVDIACSYCPETARRYLVIEPPLLN